MVLGSGWDRSGVLYLRGMDFDVLTREANVVVEKSAIAYNCNTEYVL